MSHSEIELWNAINEYAESCGGNTGGPPTERRMKAVALVGQRMQAIAAEWVGHAEAGIRGKLGVYPNWVYEAREAIRHANDNTPWLNDLLEALEWQGGTLHEALNCVRRLVAAAKEDQPTGFEIEDLCDLDD